MCTSRGTTPAKLINCRVPERSIEPRHDTFVGRRLLGTFDELGEGLLQDVFRQGAVANATLQVTQKRPMVLEQHVQRGLSFFDVHTPIVRRGNAGVMLAHRLR
jgi:hypothetical protein